MIIIKDIDNEIYLFNSIEEAENHLEAIDIENNEYEACDDESFIYKFDLIKSPGLMGSGKFKIIKTAEKDIDLPKKYFLSYGKSFSKSKKELSSIYQNASCASEAIKKLESNK